MQIKIAMVTGLKIKDNGARITCTATNSIGSESASMKMNIPCRFVFNGAVISDERFKTALGSCPQTRRNSCRKEIAPPYNVK